MAVDEYNTAYNALDALSKQLLMYDWKKTFSPLKPEDIRALSEGRPEDSEGRRLVSWIWQTTPVIDAGKEEQDLYTTEREYTIKLCYDTYLTLELQIEFAKACARSRRFAEEVELCSEEMTRTLAFHLAKSREWSAIGTDVYHRKDLLLAEREGFQLYTLRQASIFAGLHGRCAQLWQDVPAYIQRMNKIMNNPNLAMSGEFDSSTLSKMRVPATRTEGDDSEVRGVSTWW